MCLFLRKNHLLRCWDWDWVSLLNWIWALTLSLLLKLPPRKLEPFLWTSMKFLSPEVAVYLYKSTIHPCIEYCCPVSPGAPSCYLELLDRLQKQISRTIVSSFAACLEPLAHRRNRASRSFFYRYYFGRCSWKLAQLVPLSFFKGGLLVILTDCLIFLSPLLDVTRMSMSTVSFLIQLYSWILCL